MAAHRKPVPGKCEKCGVDGQLISAGYSVKCLACNKLTTKIRVPIRPPAFIAGMACPKCDVVGQVSGSGSKGGVEYVTCYACGKATKSGAVIRKVSAVADNAVYLVTAAVNDTKVSARAFATMQGIAKHRNATICVIPLRYKNPTSQREAGKADGYTWDSRVVPHLVDGRVKLAKTLQLLADIKTQPTAQDPLSSLSTITGTDCGIVGHTKVALRSIATKGHQPAKIMWTTGAITVPQYSDTTAGIKGAFHHSMGCLIVEVEPSGRFHVRQIGFASDGSAQDLDTLYSGDTVSPAPRPASLTLGDTHAEIMDIHCAQATHRLIDRLKPRALVHHDVLNFGAQSHHNDYFERFRRRLNGSDDVFRELRITCEVIDQFSRRGMETVIVSSNHHDHFRKWLESHHNALDVGNAIIYHRAKLAMLEHIRDTGKEVSPFASVAKELLRNPVRFLAPGDSYVKGGVEHCYHGDKGSNGSRGSAKNLSRIGAKVNIGHGHGATIIDGCYQAGTMSRLQGGYQDGAPSNWSHAHVVTYSNGKRAILFVHNGEYDYDGRQGGKGAESAQGGKVRAADRRKGGTAGVAAPRKGSRRKG